MPSKTLFWVLTVAAVTVYLLFSLAYLHLPGLEYDETIFVNAALGNLNDTFDEWHLTVAGHQVPVMIMRYIGAVKSYMYAPIFALFGTSLLAVRLPVVLFGLVTLTMTYLLAANMLGRGIALFTLILMAADPSFIFTNRIDWGPVALMMVFKTSALVLLWRWLERGGLLPLGGAGFLLGLGLFDKIVFAWFIAALALAFPICFWARLRRRLTVGAAVVALGAFLAGCAPLIAYNVRFPLVTFQDQQIVTTSWPRALAYRYDLFRKTLDGSDLLMMFNEQTSEEIARDFRRPPDGPVDAVFSTLLRIMPLQRSMTAVAFGLALTFFVVCAWRSRLARAREISFFALLFLLIAVCICLTAQATGPHHMMMLYPFPHVLIAYAAWQALDSLRSTPARRRKLARAAVACGVAAVVVAPVIVACGYIKSFISRGGSGKWSDAIYRLSDFSRKNPDREFMLMDWGFSAQMLVMESDRVHHREPFPRMLAGGTEQERLAAFLPILMNPENWFVFHYPRYATYPTLDGFRAALSACRLKGAVIESFFQRDGAPIYLVCSAMPPELARFIQNGGYFYFREAEEFDSCSRKAADLNESASRLRALGAHWGRSAGDYAVYRWHVARNTGPLTLGIRCAPEYPGKLAYDVLVDGRAVGSLSGDEAGEAHWRMVTFPVPPLAAGDHELWLQSSTDQTPLMVDFFTLAESGFQFKVPDGKEPAPADDPDLFFDPDVQSFSGRSDVQLRLDSSEVTAGKSTFSFRVTNLNAPAIDLLYTFDDRYAPIIYDWRLEPGGRATVPLSADTPKGVYVYKAIRDSRDHSPKSWIRVDARVVVK